MRINWNHEADERYVRVSTVKYIVLADGREIKRKEISDEEYEALKEWGYIVREFDR